jgi:hypothetical protein
MTDSIFHLFAFVIDRRSASVGGLVVIWIMTLCSFVGCYFCPDDGGSGFIRILAATYNSTRCNSPEDHNLNFHWRRESLNSHLLVVMMKTSRRKNVVT